MVTNMDLTSNEKTGRSAADGDGSPDSLLFLHHAAPAKMAYGGPVYTRTILDIVRRAYPNARIDEFAFRTGPRASTEPLEQMVSMIRSFASGYPAKVEHFRSRAFANRLTELIDRNRYQVVFINGSDMLWCVDQLPAILCRVLISHNVEHALYSQRIEKFLHWPAVGTLLRHDAAKLERFELSYMARLSGVISISSADTSYFCSRDIDLPITTVGPAFSYPVSSDSPASPKIDSTRFKLGFLGNLDWWPNRRNISWFIREILPNIPSRFELHLYGKGGDIFSSRDRVIVHGFVDDLAELWATVDVMVQPILYGSGVNIKVAETFYNRVPTVATPAALRGLPVSPDPAIVSLDGRDAWIDFFAGDGLDQLKYKRVSESNARQFQIHRKVSQLDEFLRSVCANRPRKEAGGALN